MAKENGEYTDPVAAIESILDASAEKNYLMIIASGIFNLSELLMMKEYVDISGYGQNPIILTRSFDRLELTTKAVFLVGIAFSEITNSLIEVTGEVSNSVL